jgi:UDP-GlcNAc:undecaprenyl-phosphate GlcNAc-1-phosphate transferase
MSFFSHNVLLFVVLAITIAFSFSYLINSILLKFSQNLGVRQAQTKDIRWSPTIKPSLGGISFFVIFLISFVLLSFLDDSLPIKTNNIKTLGILIVCITAFLMGLADDAYNTNPLLKLITQIICGLILYFTETKILIFHSEFLNLSLTVVWVVGIMNSINMLDNMDGITTVTSVIILLFIVAFSINLNLIFTPIPIITLGLVGALLGFLIYNWHPSKMFMGDTGSQFLGAFLAVLGIDYCWNSFTLLNHNWLSSNPILLGFSSILLIFILPITDTVTVTINRLKRGSSPFIGGKDHTTHHLFFRGITEKRIALLYIGIGSIALAITLNLLLNFSTMWLITSITFSAITFLSLYLNTVIKKK